MAVKYRLFQEQRKTSPNKGKWYARAVINDVVALEEISQEIQDNTTAKQADVYAVLKELVNVMGRHLRNGDKVVLDGQEHHRRAPQLPARNPLDGNRQDTPQAVHPGVGGENGRREGRARRRRHFGR